MFLKDYNIILRAVEPEDVEFMWQVELDSSQWIHNSQLAPYSRKNLEDYASNYDADPFVAGQIRFLIESDNGIRLGILDLYEISAQHRRAFVGIYILKKFRKLGYAQRSLELVERYAFKLLNLRILGAKIVSSNIESLNLFNKAGYKECGIMPEWILAGDKFIDMFLFTKKCDSYE